MACVLEAPCGPPFQVGGLARETGNFSGCSMTFAVFYGLESSYGQTAVVDRTVTCSVGVELGAVGRMAAAMVEVDWVVVAHMIAASGTADLAVNQLSRVEMRGERVMEHLQGWAFEGTC